MTELRDDLLVGVVKIAEWRGEPTRRTYYLLERGLLPGYKRGRIWELRKSTALADIAKRESGEVT